MPLHTESFLLLVTANEDDAGAVVFCSPWTSEAKCSGSVFGFDGRRAVLAFPAPNELYPAPLLSLPNAALLTDWIDVDRTSGNNVVTHFGVPQALVRAVAGVFPSAVNDRDQALLNAFYFCNYLHDFFLLLGFGEREGNFQLTNAASVAGGGDRLTVRLFNEIFPHLGKMDARLDGERAEMKLGVAPNGAPAALHADVIIHEYAHGVSQRMVGGRRGAATLVLRQSLALSEGWSDYFAITLRNHHLAQRDYTFASWAGLQKPARTAPYGVDYPGHYGLLGRSPHDDAHGAGEIFAAALIRFNEFLGAALNDATQGDCIGWRVVVESFRQCNPANPTLLDGRDALFRAITELAKNQLDARVAGHAREAASRAFAKYGMGPNARGPASTELRPTVPDPPR
jgi:extracellular elastinolytic metalloproteinase